METFKAYLLIVGFIGVLGFGGFWAVRSLQDPVRIVSEDEVRVVAQTPVGLDTSTNNSSSDQNNENAVVPETPQAPAPQTTPSSQNTEGKYADLISKLEKLIADNILMKEGSRGTRVGTVQEFLNVYNKTSGGIDNDYGPGTKTKVAAFQKAVGLTADGQAGPNTYQKMIDWLQTQ